VVCGAVVGAAAVVVALVVLVLRVLRCLRRVALRASVEVGVVGCVAVGAVARGDVSEVVLEGR